jgi:Endosomal/lysosomal potassium channel TMEM175
VTTPASLRPARPRDDLPGVARLLTRSDNVVAIALTLLVFQLKVPVAAQVHDPGSAADLAAQLARQADQLISYLIAFYVVAQFWLAHHRVFRQVAGATRAWPGGTSRSCSPSRPCRSPAACWAPTATTRSR